MRISGSPILPVRYMLYVVYGLRIAIVCQGFVTKKGNFGSRWVCMREASSESDRSLQTHNSRST
jgi:hypothetical protein